MSAASKRLMKEYASYKKDPNPCMEDLHPVQDDLFTWHGILKGPRDTPYEGGRWALTIQVPPTYPIQPPQITFTTPIVHPNIHLKTGEVCLDILKSQWSPAWTLSSTCTAIQVMLSNPDATSPLNIDAANLIRVGDEKAYNSLITYYKHRYAK